MKMTVSCWNQRPVRVCAILLIGMSLWVGHVTAAVLAGSTPDGTEIRATDLDFDAETGKIKYTLPKSALVRIRVGLPEGGPMLRNLIDWEPQEAGPQEIIWDFSDATGKVYFGPNPDYYVAIFCLPADSREQPPSGPALLGYRKAPRFRVEFPESEIVQDVPQISHLDPIRITLDRRDSQWLTESKYEVGLYIDNTFLMEEEEGLNPFSYRLDTRGLRAGKYKVTVNVVGYEGEVGTHTFWMNVVK